MTSLKEIADVMETAGNSVYGGEDISQLAHALQSAMHAERMGAGDALVAAALLHDIGHLIDKKFELGQEQPVDRHHEAIAAGYLAKILPPEVTEPIRLHVEAKRYLCFADQTYRDGLSSASIRSLELQGGAFSPGEAEAFISRPYAEEAVLLRRCDELAKDPECVTPSLAHYMQTVEKVAVSHAA